MSTLQRFFIALLKPIILGLTVAAILLIFIPEFRQGSGLNVKWFKTPDKAPERATYYEAISRSAPAVVNIYSVSIDNRNSIFRNRPSERTNRGSGVIMNEEGYLLTCYHVIRDADTIYVLIQDGRSLEAQIIGYDTVTDLAVLKVDAEDLHVMPQIPKTDIRVGDVVMAIGNPLDLGQTITQGIVSRTDRTNGLANYFGFIQTDAVLNPGSSGGALIDSNGYLMGITNAEFKRIDRNSRTITEVDGVNFALPYELAKRVMDEIIVSGTVTRGELGFSGNVELGSSGMTVTQVASGGPADQAGSRVNDVVLSVNGIALSNASKALEFVSETMPGTQLKLEVSRNNRIIIMTVTVGALAT